MKRDKLKISSTHIEAIYTKPLHLKTLFQSYPFIVVVPESSSVAFDIEVKML